MAQEHYVFCINTFLRFFFRTVWIEKSTIMKYMNPWIGELQIHAIFNETG